MAEMFSNPAAYERMMGRWSARLAPLFVDFAQVREGSRVLDVGCGTGSLVHAVAQITRRSEIVGIDPAQPFIDHCRSRFVDPRIAFDCGSALELPYPDDAFDQSLSLLVFMFLPQPEAAASEMRRVTRPGGTVAACTWNVERLELSSILWDEAMKLDPNAELHAERPRRCTRKGELDALWHAAGLEDVEETALEIRTEFSSFDDWWLPFVGGAGPAGAYVVGLSPERREALRAALHAKLLAGGADHPFALRAQAWAVRGTVPD